jgi:inositol oxygenase
MQVTGLVHDLGKLLVFFGAEGQWDVVGDTFVVGCRFSDKIIYPETFAANPDYANSELMTENGIYKPGCGLDNVILSWGHDEVRASNLTVVVPGSSFSSICITSVRSSHGSRKRHSP